MCQGPFWVGHVDALNGRAADNLGYRTVVLNSRKWRSERIVHRRISDETKRIEVRRGQRADYLAHHS